MAPPGVTYNVYRSATAPVPVDDAHRIASGLRQGLYLDRGGRAGLYYVVTAQNAAGESGPSNTAWARPWPEPWPPEPPIPPPIEFHWPDLTLLLPAPLLLVAVGRSRRGMGWAAPVGAVMLVVAVVCLAGAVLGSRGAVVQRSAGAEVQRSARAEEMVTRVITYTYDPLHRLTGAEYSTGESFAYAYDAVGNRTAYTATTPLSGTLVTNYTYDAARRLIARAVSDGRTYTYTWSARGQMLAEYTHGYPVRTFTYDGAGRLTAATVFTLTTRFTYTGLGDRVAVEVVRQGVTTYTLDLVAGGQILAEETLTGRVVYLYGHECLGELRDGQWLYYLADAEGLVRQGVDAGGEVVSGWLFDPDGVVLEGPEGPVSHLVCGGVYDWSTGLIYRGGRYFDPTLGLWLALAPLVVVQSWRGWRGKRPRFPWVVLVVLCLGASGMMLAGCGGGYVDEPPWNGLYCLEITPLGPPLGKRALLVGPGPSGQTLPDQADMQTWTEDRKQQIDQTLHAVMRDKFGGPNGFGSLEVALVEFNISKSRPIVLIQQPNYPIFAQIRGLMPWRA